MPELVVNEAVSTATTAESDLELVRRIAAESEPRRRDEVFAALVERHSTLLFAVCRRITANDEDAHDATQEALLAAWRALGRFDGRSKFSTWLYRIAVNEAIDQRARSNRAPLPVAELPDRPTRGRDEERVLDRMVIAAALADLSPVFRSAVVLRDVLDLTYEDTAAALGIKVDTVKSRLSRGRRALRPVMSPTLRSA